MFRNFHTISLRYLRKNSLYSFIKIAVIAAGIALTPLIAHRIIDEFSFDRYASDHGRIGVAMHYGHLIDKIGTNEVIAILLIAVLTASYQSLKAALMNPLRILRTE